ncbi:hypothetical protein L596_028560 [Steinernema carpocapsae]|uniref:Uncharacterized protein n=1 Tax=Steinernema carpocapsae TaxID=34508 RepID=A0A4V5ZXY3_STECR|nr:hypothetical protein L596_028560 [Steinernema carpocapsae]
MNVVVAFSLLLLIAVCACQANPCNARIAYNDIQHQNFEWPAIKRINGRSTCSTLLVPIKFVGISTEVAGTLLVTSMDIEVAESDCLFTDLIDDKIPDWCVPLPTSPHYIYTVDTTFDAAQTKTNITVKSYKRM